jgi:hypothetical protein
MQVANVHRRAPQLLTCTHVTDEGVDRLHKLLPDCEIIR